MPSAQARTADRVLPAITGVRYKIGWNMPTVLRIGPYRFHFYSHEPNEPPHIHIDRDDLSAKFWISPVRLGRNFGFRPRELADLERMVQDNREVLLEAWHDYFGA